MTWNRNLYSPPLIFSFGSLSLLRVEKTPATRTKNEERRMKNEECCHCRSYPRSYYVLPLPVLCQNLLVFLTVNLFQIKPIFPWKKWKRTTRNMSRIIIWNCHIPHLSFSIRRCWCRLSTRTKVWTIQWMIRETRSEVTSIPSYVSLLEVKHWSRLELMDWVQTLYQNMKFADHAFVNERSRWYARCPRKGSHQS
jgi:hypothetical protein